MQLMPIERNLDELESIIERGLQTFVAVGTALLEIRDRRLYKEAGFTRFEDYCQQRWGFTKQRGYQYIEAAEITNILSTTVDFIPETESQARELAPLKDNPEVLRAVWQDLQERFPDTPLTAKRIREVVVERLEADEIIRRLHEVPAPSHSPAQLPPRPDAALRMSETNEWYTPARYIEAARQVLGGIDVDPASCAVANTTVQAPVWYGKETNGLTHDWPGRVWLNPPYGGFSALFTARLVEQCRAGITTAAILLVNAHSTETAWFQPLWDCVLCFTDHRINFVSPDSAASGSTHGSVFAYLGPEPGRFREVFSRFGAIVGRWRP